MKNKEIAQMLQVSPSTVSLALNNKPGVSEETRRKILELKNHSLKNDIQQLSARDKGKIGLLVYKNRGDIIAETPFFIQLIESINNIVTGKSYGLNITYLSSNSTIEFIDEINQSGLVGMILIATEMTAEDIAPFCEHMQVPFVLVDVSLPGSSVDCVLMDNRSGVIQAMRYGYQMGHRKIGFVKSNRYSGNCEERFEEYRRELERLGLSYDEGYIFSVPPSVNGAREDMSALLRQNRDMPTLLIVGNDIIAMGVMDAVKDAGYAVPEDVSIIGFDDMPMSQCLTPPLTSVKLPYDRIAKIGVNRLIEKIEDEECAQYTVQQYVEVNLVVRNSVAQLKTEESI